MRSFLVVGMSLFDRLRWGCMLKMLKIASMEVGLWNDGLRMMDYNSKLVAFGSQFGIMALL